VHLFHFVASRVPKLADRVVWLQRTHAKHVLLCQTRVYHSFATGKAPCLADLWLFEQTFSIRSGGSSGRKMMWWSLPVSSRFVGFSPFYYVWTQMFSHNIASQRQITSNQSYAKNELLINHPVPDHTGCRSPSLRAFRLGSRRNCCVGQEGA
jgi:hypothetical protein